MTDRELHRRAAHNTVKSNLRDGMARLREDFSAPQADAAGPGSRSGA